MIDDLRLPPQRQTSDDSIDELRARLEKSKMPNGRPLTGQSVEKLAAADHRDFSHAKLGDGKAAHLSSLQNRFNFRDTHFWKFVFDGCDLRNADYRGADLTSASFAGCKLRGADFTTIRIQGKSLDLRKDATILTKPVPMYEMDSQGIIRGCDDAESRYREIFEGRRKSGEGIVVRWEGCILGTLKLYVEHSFLATATSIGPDGPVAFWQGGLYALESDFAQFLMAPVEMTRPLGSREWPVVDLEEALALFHSTRSPDRRIGMSLIRFLSDPSLFEKLPAWHAQLGQSTNVISPSDRNEST